MVFFRCSGTLSGDAFGWHTELQLAKQIRPSTQPKADGTTWTGWDLLRFTILAFLQR